MNRCKKIMFPCLLAFAASLPMLPGAAAARTPCLALVSDQEAKTPKPLEPSGMVWDGKSTLYIVSDNGQIVSIPVAAPYTTDPTQWTILYQWDKKGSGDKEKAANDFESVARVPGRDDFLYVGIEGDNCSKCDGSTIKELSISGKKFTGNAWLLGGTKMESMTFIPDAAVDPEGFKGYFLTAAQNSGTVHRYDLELGGKKTVTENTNVPTFTPAIEPKNSDFQFSPGNSVFYAAYDDDSEHDPAKPGKQRVVQYTRSGNTFVNGITTYLPYSRGVEAVADVLKGGTVSLYIGIDLSSKQRPSANAPNRVDLYAPFPNYDDCPCAAQTSCGLIKGTNCGWCASLHRALPGTEDGGPSVGTCVNWIWKSSSCKNN